MLGSVLNALYEFIKSSQVPCKVATLTMSIFQIRNLRLRKIMDLPQASEPGERRWAFAARQPLGPRMYTFTKEIAHPQHKGHRVRGAGHRGGSPLS